MKTHGAVGVSERGSLRHASWDRLGCLLRHWTWANEAMATFDEELSGAWTGDDDPMADHPFGAFYHWCALLCALGDAAVAHELLSPAQLESVRQDLHVCWPVLRRCQQLLVAVPASLEEHPRLVDLARDTVILPRLRRLHEAFGDAVREERAVREIESLDQ